MIDQDATPMENIMTRDVAFLDASLATVLDAASIMSEREIGSVIVTKQGFPFGIVTERDIVRRAGAKDEYTLERDVILQDIASHPLILGEPRLTIEEAAEMRVKNKIRRLPISIDGKLLLRIVTIRDLQNSCLPILIEDIGCFMPTKSNI